MIINNFEPLGYSSGEIIKLLKRIIFVLFSTALLGCVVRDVQVFIPVNVSKSEFYQDECRFHQNDYLKKTFSGAKFYLGVSPVSESSNTIDLRFSFRLGDRAVLKFKKDLIKVVFVKTGITEYVYIDKIEGGGRLVDGSVQGLDFYSIYEELKYKPEYNSSSPNFLNYYNFNSKKMKRLAVPNNETEMILSYPDFDLNGERQEIPDVLFKLKSRRAMALFNC